MEITKIIFNSLSPRTNGVCAELTLVLDDAIMIHRVTIIAGKNGLFISMPSFERDFKDGKYKYLDIVHPVRKEVSDYMTDRVLSEYRKKIGEI